ncbi:YqaJ viral recombinase family protein [Lysinibacter cavernae]|uniref:YqaJ viral recombinase domain-containing protein n=1 Tax=Lysinibacter cavernae TaxID=1640652 RepID=A0A7X5QYZ4_9MICO|nr:YqaJ viral recombinase family protein [Lysinibacter cavernae]NIH52519.1 hypothetical protein [Lysinibacter cavernae]
MTAVTYQPQALVDLQGRVLGNDSDRAAWLEARRSVITATEAKTLYKGSNADKAKIVREKVTGESSFFGNRYTEWGTYREPFIAAQLAGHGLELCGDLIHAELNSRHAATPDLIGVDFDEQIVLGEIKTANDVMAVGSPKFEQRGYLWQMLWQMYCFGATRVLFAWEQHDNDWSRWDARPMDDQSRWDEFGPKVLCLNTEWVVLTPQLEVELTKMIAAADRALARLDKQLAETSADEEPVFSPEQLADLVRHGTEKARQLVAETTAKKAKEAAQKAAEAMFTNVTEVYSEVHEGIKFTWSPPGPTEVTQTDLEAARAADPALAEALGVADAACDAAMVAREAIADRWAKHVQGYVSVVPGVPSPSKLTITKQKVKTNE